jgi:hypothetical protein
MAAPVSTTSNAQGNLLASATIAASATRNFNLDVSAKFEAEVQLGVTFGTVAATAGLQVQAFRRVGSGPQNDTNPALQFTIPAVASTTAYQSFALPTGRWNVVLTNLDATNAVTATTATSDTVDAVS